MSALTGKADSHDQAKIGVSQDSMQLVNSGTQARGGHKNACYAAIVAHAAKPEALVVHIPESTTLRDQVSLTKEHYLKSHLSI